MKVIFLACVAAALTACGSAPAQNGPAPRSANVQQMDGALRIDTVAIGLDHPWGIAFLPDGRLLVTERPGHVRIVDKSGAISEPLHNAPDVQAQGQGGLLDVAVDPAFATNQTIYLSFSEPGAASSAGTSVVSARLAPDRLLFVKTIYQQFPKVRGGNHFGGRLVFASDGKLFITQGERYDYRDQAQNLGSGLGKIVRINTDGTIPKDNPFVGQSGARPEIWSYGHRNVEAAALDPSTGQLWTVEHGAMGGDELNHPEAGKNYGWPVITYGRDYNGRKIGEGVEKAGLEQPVYYWDPVIAPSGMAFYTGDAFPADWKGNILIGGLASERLVLLIIVNGHVAREERYLGELDARIRDVQIGPDGLIYVATDETRGRILRLRPK